MVPVPLSRLQPSRKDDIEDWPWLDQALLSASRSRQVCMTCHVFRHHPGPERIRCSPASASGPDRPWRAPHPPLQRLVRRPAPAAGLGA